MQRIHRLALLLIVASLPICGHGAEDELWLIPEGHVGWLVVIPNQPDGADKEYEDGRLVFRFPESGVLKTKYGLDYGEQKQPLYYAIGKDGIRTPVFYTYNGHDLYKIKDGEPYLFFGFTESSTSLPYPEFLAIVMKVKGHENDAAIPKVEDFLLKYKRNEEALHRTTESNRQEKR